MRLTPDSAPEPLASLGLSAADVTVTIDGEECTSVIEADDVEQWADVIVYSEHAKSYTDHDKGGPLIVRVRGDVRFWWPGQSPGYRQKIEEGWLAARESQPALTSQSVVDEPSGRASMADQVSFVGPTNQKPEGFQGEDGG